MPRAQRVRETTDMDGYKEQLEWLRILEEDRDDRVREIAEEEAAARDRENPD